MAQLKSVPRFKSLICQIAKKHDLRLDVPESHLRLEMGKDSPYMTLVIEKVGQHRISVAHYYYQEGDAIPDPDVELWIAPDGQWYPVAITTPQMMVLGHIVGGYGQYVEFKNDKPVKFYRKQQHDLVRFCEQTWITNIKATDYLNLGNNPKKKECQKP